VDLWYRISGSGADTVVVPLAVFLEQPLAALGGTHTAIFYDPRHRGRSGAYADTTLSTFDHDVEDVEAVRSHFGLSKMSLVGFSYFAAVVAQYAADHPERVQRVVMMSPIEPNATLEASYQPAEAMARIDTVKARRLVRMRADGRDTSEMAGYCRTYWEVNAPVYVGDTTHASRLPTDFCDLPNEGVRAFGAHVGRVMASLRSRRDFTPVAARIRAPVLVLYGDRDLVANPEGARTWSRLIGGARIETIRGGGHMLFVDDQRRTLQLIDAFLAGR
jgi:proline iminopeptidase